MTTYPSPKALTSEQRKEAVLPLLEGIISFEQRALDTLPPRIRGLKGVGNDVHRIQRRYSAAKIEAANHFMGFEASPHRDVRSQAMLWIEYTAHAHANFAIETAAQRDVAQAILTELSQACDIDN